MQTLIHKTALVMNAGDQVGRVLAERLGALGAKVILQQENSGFFMSQTLSNIRAMGSQAVEVNHNLESSSRIGDFFTFLSNSHPVIDILIINNSMITGTEEFQNGHREYLIEIFKNASAHIGHRGHLIYLSPIISRPLKAGIDYELPHEISNSILSLSKIMGEKQAVFNTIIPYGLNKDSLQSTEREKPGRTYFSAHDTLLKRYTELDDLANLTEFLASDLSAVISGQYFLTNI
jgi:3-oxoacyl-[acyl-carrier protein] reductase